MDRSYILDWNYKEMYQNNSAITDSRYCGIAETSGSPKLTISPLITMDNLDITILQPWNIY